MIEKNDKNPYPMRINQYLAKQGISSRREADKLIIMGKIKLNGKIALLGDQVNKTDKVVVDHKTQEQRESAYVYLAFNKPIGIVSNPEQGQKSIADLVKYKTPLTPIGRLDKESHGLIILTNDTRVTSRLLESKNKQDKEYRVTVDKKLTPMFQKEITSGLRLEDFTAQTCQLTKISPTEFFLTITEGKKHQIRRMCAALGYQVKDLERVRVANINLDKLQNGKVREIIGQEKENFLKLLGLK